MTYLIVSDVLGDPVSMETESVLGRNEIIHLNPFESEELLVSASHLPWKFPLALLITSGKMAAKRRFVMGKTHGIGSPGL